VVAISYELWQRRYDMNPSVLGRVLTIRGQAATVVAVMPRGLAFPAQTEVWATARPFRAVAETGPSDFYVYLVGRLAPGATVEQSASELTNYLVSNLALLPSWLRGMSASADTFEDDLLGDVRPVIRLLLVASALVMLVAIVNVGALFSRAGAHQTAGTRRAGVCRDRYSELYSRQTCRQRRADRGSSRGVRWKCAPVRGGGRRPPESRTGGVCESTI
jgi:putative ABC transport system permease protein